MERPSPSEQVFEAGSPIIVGRFDRQVGADSADQSVQTEHDDATPGEAGIGAQEGVGQEKTDAREHSHEEEIAQRRAPEKSVHHIGETAESGTENHSRRNGGGHRQTEPYEQSVAGKTQEEGGLPDLVRLIEGEIGDRCSDQSTENATGNDGRNSAVTDHEFAHESVIADGEEDSRQNRTEGSKQEVDFLVHVSSLRLREYGGCAGNRLMENNREAF